MQHILAATIGTKAIGLSLLCAAIFAQPVAAQQRALIAIQPTLSSDEMQRPRVVIADEFVSDLGMTLAMEILGASVAPRVMVKP